MRAAIWAARIGTALALTFAAVVAVAGCAASPEHGTIRDKQYDPAYTIVTSSCSTIGKSVICTPIPIYHPAEWEFDLYASNGDHGWRDVDEHTYDTLNIGDTY